MATKIEVEWIAQSQQMNATLERINEKLDKQEQKLEQISKTSKKAADAAAGSFAALEKELKDAEAALKGMAKGTAEFEAQRQAVEKLRKEVVNAKAAMAGNVAAQSGAARLVDNFTSAISTTVGTIASVATIVTSLKQDLEAIQQKRENERLAEADFGTVLASRSIANLPEAERNVIRPLAIKVAEDLGESPTAIAEVLAELRSTGATDLNEAVSFLTEASRANPQNLAAARGIARAGLIEAGATGNRNAAEVIGGTVAAQSVSLTSSPEEFAKAFGSNIASAVSVYKMTPEQAREEAAIFSLLETRGSEVAADAQRSMLSQLAKFVPEQEKKLKAGGTAKATAEDVASFLGASVPDRQQMLIENEGLRKQFVDSLQETGRTAIIRRLQPTKEDAGIIQTAQSGIGADAESAAQLARLQETAQTEAAFGIAAGRRKAQVTADELRASTEEKLTAELEQTMAAVQQRTRSNLGGTMLSWGEAAGMRIEETASGRSRGQVLEDTLRFRAANAATKEEREFIEAQLERIEELKKQMELLNASTAEGNRILLQMLNQQKAGAPVRVMGARPQEAPPPAATIP